jgi:hypothetical protein
MVSPLISPTIIWSYLLTCFIQSCSLVMEYADNGDVFQKICSY